MDELITRKISAVAGLVVAVFTLNPATAAIANLSANPVGGAIWITFFIIGMIFAYASVMAPAGSYRVVPAAGSEKSAAAVQKPVVRKHDAAAKTSNKNKMSGFAIASFVLGLFSIVPLFGFFMAILAVIFGFISLSSIRKDNLRGKGLAIAGLVLGFLMLALYAIAFFAILRTYQ